MVFLAESTNQHPGCPPCSCVTLKVNKTYSRGDKSNKWLARQTLWLQLVVLFGQNEPNKQSYQTGEERGRWCDPMPCGENPRLSSLGDRARLACGGGEGGHQALYPAKLILLKLARILKAGESHAWTACLPTACVLKVRQPSAGLCQARLSYGVSI
jgi:hypothetical protein